MVRDPKIQDEPIESARDTAAPAKKRRVRRRPFVDGDTTVANADVTRDIIARADADFERIFGSE